MSADIMNEMYYQFAIGSKSDTVSALCTLMNGKGTGPERLLFFSQETGQIKEAGRAEVLGILDTPNEFFAWVMENVDLNARIARGEG